MWVSYKEGVYDITDFILSHPGGVSKIMLAAGKAIDPFWRVYQQHENSKLPRQLLAGMRIGSLDPTEPPLVRLCLRLQRCTISRWLLSNLV